MADTQDTPIEPPRELTEEEQVQAFRDSLRTKPRKLTEEEQVQAFIKSIQDESIERVNYHVIRTESAGVSLKRGIYLIGPLEPTDQPNTWK